MSAYILCLLVCLSSSGIWQVFQYFMRTEEQPCSGQAKCRFSSILSPKAASKDAWEQKMSEMCEVYIVILSHG